jgi:endonuclease YncB( thermonuclease family)
MKRPLLALALLVPLLAWAGQFEGVVTHVTDGDTLWVRPDGREDAVKVRIDGIDAPEICQPFGREAREALAMLLLAHRVRVTTRARDVYHRIIGRVTGAQGDAGAFMVAQGMAWSTGFRGRRGRYAPQEAQARASRTGLWRGAPEEPRSFRERHGSCHR